MIYTVIGTIQVFGLNAFAVRLPTAIASVATLVAVFWLSREMGWSKRVSFVAMLLLTLAYWHITQARNTYEPMVGLFFSGRLGKLVGRPATEAVVCRCAWSISSRIAVLQFAVLLMPILFVCHLGNYWTTTQNMETKTDLAQRLASIGGWLGRCGTELVVSKFKYWQKRHYHLYVEGYSWFGN